MDELAMVLAAAAGVLAVIGLKALLPGVAGRQLRRAGKQIDLLVVAFQKATSGERLERSERVRLSVASFCCMVLLTAYLADLWAALVAGFAAPWLVSRFVSWRQRRFGRRVDESIPDMARALADLVAGGSSVRGALSELAMEPLGPLRKELTQIGLQLRCGATTDEVLGRFGRRVQTRRAEQFVTAVLLQRRVGGDLPQIMREIAKSAEEQESLVAEARTASAQARFTAVLVLLLPAGAAFLAELSSPGFLSTMLASFMALWLVGLSVVCQVIGFLLIRRMSRSPLKGVN